MAESAHTRAHGRARAHTHVYIHAHAHARRAGVAEKKRGRQRLVAAGVDTEINGRPLSLSCVCVCVCISGGEREREERPTTTASNRLSGTSAVRFRSIGFCGVEVAADRDAFARSMAHLTSKGVKRERGDAPIPLDTSPFGAGGRGVLRLSSDPGLRISATRRRRLALACARLKAHRDALSSMCVFLPLSFSLPLSLSPFPSLHPQYCRRCRRSVVFFVLLNSVAVLSGTRIFS